MHRTPALILTLIALPALAMAMGEGVQSHSKVPATANASLINLKGQPVGTALLTQMPDGVHIRLDATNLPAGPLAFHVHQTGMCDSANGFTSAGAHFNPTGNAHGHEVPGGAHAGDMRNLNVSRDGTLHTEVINSGVTLDHSTSGLLDLDGAALVIHAKPDDYKSQPAGAAGDRIVCGVIKAGQ